MQSTKNSQRTLQGGENIQRLFESFGRDFRRGNTFITIRGLFSGRQQQFHRLA